MKKVKYTLATLMVAAIVAVVLVGCKKEEENSGRASMNESNCIDLASMPIYFNEKLVESFSESDYLPSKDADMDLVCIVDNYGQHYFNQDLIFNQFCTANQMETIYQYSGKLNLINQKALELGLEDADMEDAPQTMADYWQSVFGYSIDYATSTNRSIAIKLYDGGHWDGKSKTFFVPCKSKLGDMDDKTSSFSQFIGGGATVFCYNKWFGGTRRWYWFVGGQSYFTIENLADNNQYSSYFTVFL